MKVFRISAILVGMVKKAWTYFLFIVVKGLIGIRYRIKVKGLERLTPEHLGKPGGILFLPNHPAEIDPVLIVLSLWLKFRPRPVVVENFFYLAGAHYLMKLVGALPLPDMNGTVNKWKQKKIEKMFHYVSEELKKGENFLIYPAGRLKVTGAEILGGASFVHNLLKECPHSNLVLIRTTGLWGSRFSRALTGSTPDFATALWEGLKIVLKNGIFLTPRRQILIEVEPSPPDFPYTGARLEVNQYLEKWYNKNGPEPLKLVSDLFWKKKFPAVYSPKEEQAEEEKVSIAPELEREIFVKIGELARKSPESITKELHLSRDLGLDSLDVAQIYVFLDEQHEVEGLTPGNLQTVGDVLKAAAGQREKAPKSVESVSEKPKWPADQARPSVSSPVGKTIAEAFLRSCERMDNHTASADAIYGIMTYRKWKLSALVLARKIRELEGDRIGVLLPSSSVTYLLIFAILLAGKVPVMFNWTAGVRALDHCAQMSGVKCVLSSRRFLNNLNNGDLGQIDDQLILLEDLKEEITLKHQLRALLDLLKDPAHLMRDLKIDSVSEDDPAVVLFTSGTESLPKGVPLSHRNILSNQASSLSCVEFKIDDILYGVLPPFHSFGFSFTGVMPILAGLKVYYAPDPTNNHGMVHDIAAWKTTLFVCAPTFIRGVFHVAKPEQLVSLRYIVAGAEKVPQELFEYVENKLPHALLFEGYGITECAPVVTLQRPGKPHIGVGEPIPGVEVRIIEEEQGDGEICIHGPNVFTGYLGSQKAPFIELEGKRWYRSGDRGHLDAQGNLILSGRLKRFVKVGGEMVSLGGVEEELIRLATERKWTSSTQTEGPLLAIGVRERESERPLLVLFTTLGVSKEEVNAALRDCGYGRIVKIADVRKLERIPVTATGKVHYSALDEII